MTKPYRVRVFGKAGCQKCDMLKRRLGKLLSNEAWSDFDQSYSDVESEEGLVTFCRAQCLNPSRIPALLIERRNEDTGQYELLANPSPGVGDAVFGASKLYQWLGLQTDYSDTGKGLITPKMLTDILEEARAS